ncbi:MAG: T9SS type A sorting domain-containing protein, partial [Candidatus Eisenbacteria bacterium]
DVPPPAAPARLSLAAPAPNPARRRTSVSYEIPSSAAGRPFTLDLYDMAGRRVRRLAQGSGTPGRYGAQWDLRDGRGDFVRSGLYLLVLEAAGERRSRRLVVLP